MWSLNLNLDYGIPLFRPPSGSEQRNCNWKNTQFLLPLANQAPPNLAPAYLSSLYSSSSCSVSQTHHTLLHLRAVTLATLSASLLPTLSCFWASPSHQPDLSSNIRSSERTSLAFPFNVLLDFTSPCDCFHGAYHLTNIHIALCLLSRSHVGIGAPSKQSLHLPLNYRA